MKSSEIIALAMEQPDNEFVCITIRTLPSRQVMYIEKTIAMDHIVAKIHAEMERASTIATIYMERTGKAVNPCRPTAEFLEFRKQWIAELITELQAQGD